MSVRSISGDNINCYHSNIDKIAFYGEHAIIKNQMLPYIIAKKQSKQSRKAMSSFGALLDCGLAQGLRKMAKGGWKKIRGTKGVHRKYASQWLTHHFLTHNSELANAIVSELYSEDEMIWLKIQKPDVTVDFLMSKMKST